MSSKLVLMAILDLILIGLFLSFQYLNLDIKKTNQHKAVLVDTIVKDTMVKPNKLNSFINGFTGKEID